MEGSPEIRLRCSISIYQLLAILANRMRLEDASRRLREILSESRRAERLNVDRLYWVDVVALLALQDRERVAADPTSVRPFQCKRGKPSGSLQNEDHGEWKLDFLMGWDEN